MMTSKSKIREQSAEAGRRGPDVRSDCWVSVTLADAGGLDVSFAGKVAGMYGRSTRDLIVQEMKTLGLEHARVEIEDGGALPFVVTARVETAVRRLGLDVGEGCRRWPSMPATALNENACAAHACIYQATSRSSC
jgi:citrate lyase acyl carrier protein